MKKKQKKSKPLIVWNTTKHPIVIVTKWTANPLGGPAFIDSHHMIDPGQGIDLACIGFSQIKKRCLGRRLSENM
jgi:hypothetical protein